MKKLLQITFILSAFTLFSICAEAGNISLQINHMAGEQAFSLNTENYETNDGKAFKITRCQYYISGIELVHDGGQTTELTDVYLLVNANQSEYELGDFDFENLEAINYHIGIEESVNLGDPALYPTGHPLSLSFNPPMHWGWASGYRFAAIEGNQNPDLGQGSTPFQYHAVSNDYYTSVSIATDGAESINGDATIVLNADLIQMLESLSLSTIEHGTGPNNQMLMNNLGTNSTFSFVEIVENNPSPSATIEVVSTGSSATGISWNESIEASNTISNLGTESIDVEWTLKSNTTPESWNLEICTPDGCTNQNEGTFVAASGITTLTAKVFPNSGTGSGTVTVEVRNPNTDEQYDVSWTFESLPVLAGIDDLPYANNVQVYPNPAQRVVNVAYDFQSLSSNSLNFVVTDLNGKEILQQTHLNTKGNIVLDNKLNAGVYLYYFYSDNNLLTRNKLVVIR